MNLSTTTKGDIYNELQQFKKSDDAYELSLMYRPDNIQVLNNYSYYLALRGVDLEKAKLMSKKTIEMSPEEYNYYDTYAWILFKMKKYKEAKKQMLLSIKNGGDKSFVIMDHMGDILFRKGEKEKARFYWEESIKLGGNKSILIDKIENGISNE